VSVRARDRLEATRNTRPPDFKLSLARNNEESEAANCPGSYARSDSSIAIKMLAFPESARMNATTLSAVSDGAYGEKSVVN